MQPEPKAETIIQTGMEPEPKAEIITQTGMQSKPKAVTEILWELNTLDEKEENECEPKNTTNQGTYIHIYFIIPGYINKHLTGSNCISSAFNTFAYSLVYLFLKFNITV